MRRLSANVWIAILFILIMGCAHLYYYDITFHGPDQIRDMAVARNIVHGNEWPVDGPSLFSGRFSLPPAFYYILALPLFVWDSEAAVFLAFGFAFVASVAYLWRQICIAMGEKVGLFYVVLAFPQFASMYTHSAWNPALTMTVSNILLGLFVVRVNFERRDWLPVVLVFFLLLQIHPSGLPLLLGLLIYVLRRPKILLNRGTVFSIALVMVLAGIWLAYSDVLARLNIGELNAVTTQGHASRLWNILDLTKWRDAFLMPYSSVAGILPVLRWASAVSAIHLACLLLGFLFGIFSAVKNHVVRWLLLCVAGWFAVSMLFLAEGAFWHLDVIYPWMALISASGLVFALDRMDFSGVVSRSVALIIFGISISGVVALYQGMERFGRFDLRVSSLFFPRMKVEGVIPAYTYKQQKEVHDYFLRQGACDNQIAGLEFAVMREIGSRFFDVGCQTSGGVFGSEDGYFISSRDDEKLFDFVKNIKADGRFGAIGVYKVVADLVEIEGVVTNNIVSNRRVSYMAYQPARLEQGVRLSIHPRQPYALVRVALRCAADHPVGDDGWWRINGGQLRKKPVMTRNEYLGWFFYDVEFAIAVNADASAVNMVTRPQVMDCDVYAVSRSLMNFE